jgi:hypothetical protein
MNPTVQVTCPNCQKLTWAYAGMSLPCQTCGAPVNLPAGAAPPQGQAMPQGFTTPPAAAAPPTKVKVGGISIPLSVTRSPIKMVIAMVAVAGLAIGGWYLKDKFLPKKGVVSFGSLGVDKSKPPADDLYAALSKDAKKWKRDATFWSLNLYVRMDGTVDLSQPANIAYVSPENSASSLKKTRSSSLRKYTPTGSGMKSSSWGWNEPVKDIEPHPTPACSIKQLVGKLHAEGKLPGPTVRITFDPKFADYYAWTVFTENPAKSTEYSWENCEPIK